MPRKAMTKADGQYLHARRRAMERYHIDLSGDLYRCAVNQCRRGSGQYVGKITNRLSQFVVTLEGIACQVVYDRNRHTIATFLPADCGIMQASEQTGEVLEIDELWD